VSLPEARIQPMEASAAGDQVLSFLLDGKIFGVPLLLVAEIHPYRPLNKMPHMPKGVEGLLDLRGQVIPVVNLRARLGHPPREDYQGTLILVIETAGFKTGLLVDTVDGVVHRGSAQFREASRLLAGKDGGWVTGFLVQGERIICLIDPSRAANPSPTTVAGLALNVGGDLESRLDDSLRELIALAPERGMGKGRVVPQIESTIAHTETEMGKVLEQVEGMLRSTDRIFSGVARLKQEAALGHLKGEEGRLAELEHLGQQIQDGIFETMQVCQFQDIARQKLERVLRNIQGIQTVVGKQFKEGAKYR
jgi:purine-binding chemotaxis protein CheW